MLLHYPKAEIFRHQKIRQGKAGTVRIAASKLDRLITDSENLLTTRLFITHRLQELESIPERSLPRSVQERYRWAPGDLDGAEVLPMRRRPGR